MGYKCCVPQCRSNYDKENEKFCCFSFPKDELQKKKWLAAIPRQDFPPSPYSKVCELHFLEGDTEKESKYFDEKEGRLLTVPLKKFRLKPTAIPSIFPNCPQYLSKNHKPREDPEERIAFKLAIRMIEDYDLELNECAEGHASEIIKYFSRATINTLLNNYCKRINDTPKPDTKRRKLATVTKN